MNTSQSTVDFILEQMSGAGRVSARKMFGGYAIYCHGKTVALVCNDELFVKITPAGKAFLSEYQEMPPFPGAKPWFFISGEYWDDHEWLSSLIRISLPQIPPPKSR